MINCLKFYTAEGYNPHYNLAIEQHLLETVPEGCCILFLWQNKNTVVIGRNQNPWKECRTTELEKAGGTLARRLSGGGAVFHDLGNLNFTFLVPTCDYNLDKQLQVIIEACRNLGINAEKSGRNDLLVGGRKFSGNAYYEMGDRSYHHGTLLVNADMEMLSKYLKPSKAKLASKGVDSVRSRVINLKEIKEDLTINMLKDVLVSSFERIYGFNAERLEMRDKDLKEIDELYKNNSSWEWIYGKKIPFTFQCEDSFSWGEIQLQAEIDQGRIKHAMVYSDAMEWAFAGELEKKLEGIKFCMDQLQCTVGGLNCSSQVKEDIINMLRKQEI